MHTTRRRLIETALFGAGMTGLRAMATGLPLAAFTRPLQAVAQEAMTCADKAAAKYLILSTSAAGDPLNASASSGCDIDAGSETGSDAVVGVRGSVTSWILEATVNSPLKKGTGPLPRHEILAFHEGWERSCPLFQRAVSAGNFHHTKTSFRLRCNA